MSSKRAKPFCRMAAWRFSAPTTAAFAVGTAVAFLSVYLVVAAGVRTRSDAWLLGESDLLTEVVNSSPEGSRHEELVRQVAELAEHEVAPRDGRGGATEAPVFFLVTTADARTEVWVGPRDQTSFTDALRSVALTTGEPQSVVVQGWEQPFRVVAQPGRDGSRVYLGFLDQQALSLLGRLKRTFALVWGVMVVFGFTISCLNAERILRRVEEITDTAATIGSLELHRRVQGSERRDEIGRLAATFNNMLDRIEASVQEIRSITDSVAHDLRSPMTSIRGNLEMALTGRSEDELREACAAAIGSLDGLLRSITASLDVAEAEAGALRIEPREIDLSEMARELVSFFRPAADEQGVTLGAEGGTRCMAQVDPDLLKRALANLLDNAVQHLPPGTTVQVRTEMQDSSVLVSVTDDGPGFPPELAGRAFDRFVKGPDSEGHGIGLALVRAAARAHGGDAHLRSGPGRRTTITLMMPAAPDAGAVRA